MEGCLSEDAQPPWDSVPREEIFGILHMAFCTITVAMRFEPANAKFFHQEVCFIYSVTVYFLNFSSKWHHLIKTFKT